MTFRRPFPSALFTCASIMFVVFSSTIVLGAELKQQTIKAWNDYLNAAEASPNVRMLGQTPFLWVDAVPDRSRRVRAGQIIVAPAYKHMPKRVPGGLIHDWIGAVFIPGAHAEDVLRVIRDYPEYKQFYRPTIVDSAAIDIPSATARNEDRFSVRFLNRSVLSKTAFDADYAASYVQSGPGMWYSVGYTTRLREIRNYGKSEQRELPPGEGHGYIWRLYTVTRLAEKDGGVYMEVEAIALSRDIPISLRWVAVPIVRRVCRDAISTSLVQTEDAVRAAIARQNRGRTPVNTLTSIAGSSPSSGRSK